MDKPIHVSDADFEDIVLRSSVPMVVDFWAPWCGPCRIIAPILEEIANQYADKVIVAKVNTDDDPEWAIQYAVQGIPTLLFIENGEEKDRLVGAAPGPALRSWVEALLKEAQAVYE
ncbi:MAG: thioredoxin [Anaerolineae bacterium]|jgi:thioredoxin 1